MTDAPANRDASLTISADGPLVDLGWFVRSADWIARGALALGVLRGAKELLLSTSTPATELPGFLGAVAGACYEIVLYSLIGLAAAALVRALGVWAESKTLADRDRSTDSDVLTQALSRLATAHDGRRAPEAVVDSPTISAETAAVCLAEIRRLTREGEWDAAEEAVRSFRSDHPDDPRGSEVSEELERAMQAALEHFEAQLQAARGVNDPNQVLEIHARMRPLVGGEKRKSLDVDLARWFLVIVHRRLRVGRIQPDVVALADRIAESFGHTSEGASLRAALPTLRRSAGLCPRCAKPYTGLAEACPDCLKLAPAPPASFEQDELDELPVENREPDWFVDSSNESAA